MKPPLTSADKCDCVSVTVRVLVLNITATIVHSVLSLHLCDSRNDDQLGDRQTLNREALSRCSLAGLDNSVVDGLLRNEDTRHPHAACSCAVCLR